MEIKVRIGSTHANHEAAGRSTPIWIYWVLLYILYFLYSVDPLTLQAKHDTPCNSSSPNDKNARIKAVHSINRPIGILHDNII